MFHLNLIHVKKGRHSQVERRPFLTEIFSALNANLSYFLSRLPRAVTPASARQNQAGALVGDFSR